MEHLLTTIRNITREQDLPVLLIGGHAVTALGHPRATYDVDLLIPHSCAHRWREQLLKLGYCIFGESQNFLQFEADSCDALPALDLMLVEDPVFEALHAEREKSSVLPTPSPSAMIALKLHAIAQPSRRSRDKDWSDIFSLIHIYRLTLDDPSFHAIVLKHGGEAAITRIRDHLAGRD